MNHKIIAFSLLTASVVLNNATAATETFTKLQTSEIEKITQNYLINHPEILLTMSQKLQAQQAAQQQDQLSTSAFKLKNQLMQVEGIPFVGPKNAKVTVTEFFDYQCMFCSKVSPIVEQLVKDNPEVKFVFRDWPIFASRWPESNTAAQTGLAIYKEAGQTAYLKYHNGIFHTGHDEGKLTSDDITKVASSALDNPLKLDDVKGYTTTIEKNSVLAQAIGAQGTPLFVVMPANPKDSSSVTVIPGAASLDRLQDAINQAK
ncbi:DsbA family protein [Rosenbergiella collisarenosi]|uniref:DsbA family protein n=1 Tax=Rosenbergiella collisarenosi TaxID=1544695 RepID=UPI001F4D3F95|nr:DsbA family protein [Rosenbergiella collisarenosi]